MEISVFDGIVAGFCVFIGVGFVWVFLVVLIRGLVGLRFGLSFVTFGLMFCSLMCCFWWPLSFFYLLFTSEFVLAASLLFVVCFTLIQLCFLVCCVPLSFVLGVFGGLVAFGCHTFGVGCMARVIFYFVGTY